MGEKTVSKVSNLIMKIYRNTSVNLMSFMLSQNSTKTPNICKLHYFAVAASKYLHEGQRFSYIYLIVFIFPRPSSGK